VEVKTPENLETVIELGELPKIEADKDMMKRIFVNLAVNGIQAMNEKGGTLKVSTKKTNVFIEVKFKDTGIGIKKENIQKIFTPFFTTKAQGIGVGLSICKRFTKIHDGSIKVESEEGKGSIFTVNLPIQRNGGVKCD
jgi:signal transduction histidine kinase